MGLSPYVQSVFTAGIIYAIVAVGLYVTLASGQFSVIHATLMGFGGYTAGVLSEQVGWAFWPAVLAAGITGLIAGSVLAVVVRNMRGMLLGLATLAIGQAGSAAVINIGPLGGSLGYVGVPLRTSLGAVLVVLVVVLAALTWLRHTRLGLALLAVGKDDVVAQALGIPVFWTRVWAFGVGGAFAGIAGGLLIQFTGLIEPPDLGFSSEVPIFSYVIVGGLSTPWGAVLGAVGITWALELLRFSTLDRYWILGLILVLVVLLRPSGILKRVPLRLSAEEHWRVWLEFPGTISRDGPRAFLRRLEPVWVSRLPGRARKHVEDDEDSVDVGSAAALRAGGDCTSSREGEEGRINS